MNSIALKGLKVLYKKEISDHLRSKKFAIIISLICIIGFGSIYSVGYGIRDAVNKENSGFVFLLLFTSSGNSLPSFVSFISFLGPLIGLTLGFDSINGERARGTLSRLLAQPIFRDAVINGKFLAGTTILSIIVVSLCIGVSGLGIILIGVPPTLEEIGRLLVYLILTILYISIWYAISVMFSLIFKQTATSALAGIALWLFLTVFVGLIAGILADLIYPIDTYSPVELVFKHQNLKQNISRISPTTIYNEGITMILNPSVRTLGLVLTSQLEGAIPSPLPFTQSLALIWAHVVAMIGMIVACFAVSYITFMKQEIRSI